MSRLQKMKEKHQKLSRFQALKSIFSSLFMTVTIVVVATIVVPASPKASIESLEAFNNTIVYNINVTDSDNAIKPQTLKVLLLNQFEEYESYLEIGENTGSFANLNSDTEYKIKVMADKGYGYEVLDSETIDTAPNTGGAFSYIGILNENEWSYDYQIDYFISDPFNEYQSIQLRYGYMYEWEEEILHYTTVPLSLIESTYTLFDVSNENVELYMYLEAMDLLGEIIILDETSFHTPYSLSGSVYTDRIEDEAVNLSVYAESMDSEMEVEYEVQILLHDYVVDSQSFTVAQEEEHMHHEGNYMLFDDLIPETTYQVKLIAKYDDPYTLAYTEAIIQSIEFTTLKDIEFTYTIQEFDTYYEITIELDDPENQFTHGYYNIYEVTEFGNFVLESNMFILEEQDELLVVTFIVSKVDTQPVIYEFGIKSSVNFSDYIIIETVDNQEEVLS